MSVRTPDTNRLKWISPTGFSPSPIGLPIPFGYPFLRLCLSLPQRILLFSVWPPPLSLAATHRISFDFSSSAYLDVSLRRVPSLYYFIHIMILDSSSRWFPNSEICGSMLIYNSPQLIAVSHVLRRLPMPRHSPYALFRLNFSYL